MLKTIFERVIVISLRSRKDRLDKFQTQIDSSWPFRMPEIFYGIARDNPNTLNEKPGEYGCHLSHVAVMHSAIINRHASVFVLEDDAFFCSDFASKAVDFLQDLPADWDGLMLGGSHKTPPTKISNKIVRCTRTYQTHAYACRGELIEALHREWNGSNRLICESFATLQKKFKVYAPERFLIGQRGGYSDIQGGDVLPHFGNAPLFTTPIIVLEIEGDSVAQLASIGFHFGTLFHPSFQIDFELRSICLEPDFNVRVERIRHWIDINQACCEDCSSEGIFKLCTVRNSALPFDELTRLVRQSFTGEMIAIKASRLDSVIAQLPCNLVGKLNYAGPIRAGTTGDEKNR